MKVHQRVKNLQKWHLATDEEWSDTVKGTGLGHLQHCMSEQYNVALINAMIERWAPETNTFKMPFGAMTITLHDAHYLLGLPIDGAAVVPGRSSGHQVYEDLALALGMTDQERKTEEMGRRGFKCQWLIDRANDPQLRRHNPAAVATAFLLYLMCSTLFPDKSNDRLPIALLTLLEQHNMVGSFSWGGAAVCTLYRRLGEATRTECRAITGCMTLLEVCFKRNCLFSCVIISDIQFVGGE